MVTAFGARGHLHQRGAPVTGPADPADADDPAGSGGAPVTGPADAAHAADTVNAAGTGSAARLTWRRVFPGDQRELWVLRRWLEALLPGCAVRDDTIAAAVELATNAIKFSASGRGGSFAVQITCSGAMVRIAVADSGAPTAPRLIIDPASEHGRGLQIVRALAIRTGVCGDHRGRLVWADIACADHSAARPATPPTGYDDALRHDHTALAERFAGVPVWFGQSTLRWWAAPGRTPGRLLTAPSAADLAAQLDRLLAPRAALHHIAAAALPAEPAAGRADAGVPGTSSPAPAPGRFRVPVPAISPAHGRVSVPAAPPLRPVWPQLSRLRARPC